MVLLKFFPAVAALFVYAVLLNQASACSCVTDAPELCDYYDAAAVVVHATVLSRTDGQDINDDATYTVNTLTFYKQEPDVVYVQVLTFVTGGNSATCGVQLDIGEEYLFGFYRSSEDPFGSDAGGQLTVGLCDLVQVWSSVDEDELAGCGIDPCGGGCGEYQDCMHYERNGKWYCSDICTEGACPAETTCRTRKRKWCRRSTYSGCPEKRSCKYT